MANKSTKPITKEGLMEFNQFHNALRILASIDRDELDCAGAIDKDDDTEWNEFRIDPFRWFFKVPDNKALKVWKLMKKRFGRGKGGEKNG